jgi:YegS/Rv2252/BmrU family lipid kinase
MEPSISTPGTICIIVNPAAARGRSGRRLREVRALLGTAAEFRETRERGHAEELAIEAARAGFGTVVAAGGDGTVHEVANGLLRADDTNACFGVIPLGSGNDYASALAIPRDLHAICARLQSMEHHQVDVGLVTDEARRTRYFVNTLGAGLSGAVSWESLGIKWLRGLALYGLSAVQAIRKHFKAVDAVLTFDEVRAEWPTLYFALALGQREGGSFIVAPEARLDDGLFDYLHAGRVSRLRALAYLPRLLRGRIPANDPVLRVGRCKRLVLECAESLPVHLDGEMFINPGGDVRRVEVELLPQRLRIRGACASPVAGPTAVAAGEAYLPGPPSLGGLGNDGEPVPTAVLGAS